VFRLATILGTSRTTFTLPSVSRCSHPWMPNSLVLRTERVETPPPPSLLIPFHRDPDFVERKELFDQIRRHCAGPGSWTALIGLGGVGCVYKASGRHELSYG
jgi:hypothetical protein